MSCLMETVRDGTGLNFRSLFGATRRKRQAKRNRDENEKKKLDCEQISPIQIV